MSSFRTRENLNSIYVLLFLNIAFFVLRQQEPERYEAMFRFDPGLILRGEVWRLFTFQFVERSALGLFFTLLFLYILGSALEAAWGTADFVTFFILSTLGSAAVGFIGGFTMLASFFTGYSLLFAYANMFPDQVFYIFFFIPVRVRYLAWIGLGFLVVTSLIGNLPSIAALAGAGVSFGFYYWRQRMAPLRVLRPEVPKREVAIEEKLITGNLALFERVREALGSDSREKVDAYINENRPHIVPGVNICPPADFKPESEDRYCARCEGFTECSIRYITSKAGSNDRPGPAESSIDSESQRPGSGPGG